MDYTKQKEDLTARRDELDIEMSKINAEISLINKRLNTITLLEKDEFEVGLPTKEEVEAIAFKEDDKGGVL